MESNPIGLRGGINTFGYVRQKPIKHIDPDGLKARVCCKGVTFAGMFGFKHCYIEVEPGSSTQCCQNGGGSRKTFGLFGNTRGPSSSFGVISTNDGFDNGGDCGEWVDTCEADRCVDNASGNYNNPSLYRMIRGPNSNTYAGTLARKCGLSNAGIGGVLLGWDDPPAPPAGSQ